ncbi:FlaD/FlaE family flagellar protein [Natronomonas gomsonensis]|uniref:FlaD/FlaE family flagellar protein n=1 Tax=Natronomonas gomsonensis TaxID=1046043 RepID=UPI0015BFDE6D|nr:FlaD/FlaE family flagellar protein [Natronomonas gomsonensis]
MRGSPAGDGRRIMDIFEQLFGGGEQSMSDAEPEESAIDTDPPEPDAETDDDDERALRDLDVRVGDLESSLEQTESSLKAIRSQQSELSEDIEEVNDTVRQLLGVYDQLTAESNPFEDGTAGSGFGVVESPENDVEDTEPIEPTEDSHTDDEEVVTFEDLTDGETDANVDPVDDEEFLWDEEQSAVDDLDPKEHTEGRISEERTSVPAEAAAELTEIEGGYAADLLVFEWLSELVCASGPASTLKALDYYESVGWISPSVRRELEAVLSGPYLDAHVDPGEPSELSAGNHADSHGYVRRLGALASMDI